MHNNEKDRPTNAARRLRLISTPVEVEPPIWYSGHDPQGCCFSRDGLELYFSSIRPGGYGHFDIWVAMRETVDVGALQFDGIDDHIITDSVVDPTNGPFSVFAWIKDGAPGQVVVSQQAMANWLTIDADGNLMTELKCTGRSTGPLFS
jgi:hypothetical protein